MTSLIGSIAGICTTISFLPQVIRIFKTKDTKGISLLMYIVFTLGVGCWMAYGLMLHEMPIVICNAITFVLATTILGFKIKYG